MCFINVCVCKYLHTHMFLLHEFPKTKVPIKLKEYLFQEQYHSHLVKMKSFQLVMASVDC